MYTCPVCFYSNLNFIPFVKDYGICPSCGTEFGYDDIELTHEQLREAWINKGCKWWSKNTLDKNEN
jgi:hypothetical protein